MMFYSCSKIYWTDQFISGNGIKRINTDGSGSVETVVTSASDTKINGIALDIQGYVYMYGSFTLIEVVNPK